MKISAFIKQQFSLTFLLGVSLFCLSCTATDPENRLAREDRECRAVKMMGTKIRQSVCLSKEEWSRIDAAEATRVAQEDSVDDFLRRNQEFNSQFPVSPGDRYNPFPGSQ